MAIQIDLRNINSALVLPATELTDRLIFKQISWNSEYMLHLSSFLLQFFILFTCLPSRPMHDRWYGAIIALFFSHYLRNSRNPWLVNSNFITSYPNVAKHFRNTLIIYFLSVVGTTCSSKDLTVNKPLQKILKYVIYLKKQLYVFNPS